MLLLLLLVLIVKLLLFPKLVRMHVVVHISIDFFVLGGGDDDAAQLVNLPISFGALLLYHALETMVLSTAPNFTLREEVDGGNLRKPGGNPLLFYLLLSSSHKSTPPS
jgi:hypothetical protein